MGPSCLPSSKIPCAKKLASAVSNRASLSMCVMYRLPLIAKQNPAGTAARHPAHAEGRVSE
jgi:hypothetical protein